MPPAELNPAAFDVLLAWLNNDRERAGVEYELLRARLSLYFERRGAADSALLVDQTLDTLARRLAAGLEIHHNSRITFIFGIACNLLRDSLKKHPSLPLDRDIEAPADYNTESEHRLACLERCLSSLSPGAADLVQAYYRHQGAEKIAAHRRLTQTLGISPEALRRRIFRIRQSLAECTRRCISRSREV